MASTRGSYYRAAPRAPRRTEVPRTEKHHGGSGASAHLGARASRPEGRGRHRRDLSGTSFATAASQLPRRNRMVGGTGLAVAPTTLAGRLAERLSAEQRLSAGRKPGSGMHAQGTARTIPRHETKTGGGGGLRAHGGSSRVVTTEKRTVLPSVVVGGTRFWRIFSHNPSLEGARPDFSRSFHVPVEEVRALAKGASRVHIRSAANPAFSVTSAAGSFPIRRLRQGKCMSLTTKKASVSKTMAQSIWHGDSRVVAHMVSRAPQNEIADHGLSVALYHASGNQNGLHIIHDRFCGWKYGSLDAIEVYIDPSEAWVNGLGYGIGQTGPTTIPHQKQTGGGGATTTAPPVLLASKPQAGAGQRREQPPKLPMEELEDEVNEYKLQGVQCYVGYEHTKSLVQESIGKISKLTPQVLSKKLSEAHGTAEQLMHPSLCLEQADKLVKDLDMTVSAYRRYGRELKEYKDKMIEAHVIGEECRLCLLEHMGKIARLSTKGLKAKLEESSLQGKKYLEPSLAINQSRVIMQILDDAVQLYVEQGQRIQMITSKYVLPTRFKIRDSVRVKIQNTWKSGRVVKLWEMGYPYKVELRQGRSWWVTEDSDAEIKAATGASRRS